MLSIGVCCSPGPEDFPTGWSYQQSTSGVIQQHGHLHPASIYKQMNKRTLFETNVFYQQTVSSITWNIAKHCQANLLGDGASDEFPKLSF